MLVSLCGTPMLLWLPAMALARHPDFRHTHMPEPPTMPSAAAAAAEPELSSSAGLGQEAVVAEPADVALAGSKKED